MFGPGGAPVSAQDIEQAGREHDVAVLGPLAVLDAEQHALGIDVGNLETDSLADAQAGSIADHQRGT